MNPSRYLLSALALVAVTSAHAATIADLANDFDYSTNTGLTNGWTYGYSTVGNASNFLLDDSSSAVGAAYGPNTAAGWSSTTSPTGIYPYVAENLSNWNFGGVQFTQGTVIMHPGNAASHLYSVARYTADTNLGYVSFSGMFERLESSGSSSYGVYRNGILVSGFGGTLTGTGAAFGPSNAVVLLNAGDRLDVVVGPGSDSYSGDVNRVSATISTVPGPASGLVFALGALRRRNRTKRA